MQPERKGLHFTAMISHTMQIILQELISDIDTQIASVKKAFFRSLVDRLMKKEIMKSGRKSPKKYEENVETKDLSEYCRIYCSASQNKLTGGILYFCNHNDRKPRKY